MAKRRRSQRPRNRRLGQRRALHGRRRSDFWYELGKLLGLLASTAGAIVGQAELIGEPYRHWLTVLAVACTAGFGYLLGPDSIRLLVKHWKERG